MELRKSKHVIANRPIGFIYEYEGVRLIYIAEDNQYYEGHYLDCYTPEMFMERETKGVVTTTEIVFTLGEKAQAA
jgi:hypothetical protein